LLIGRGSREFERWRTASLFNRVFGGQSGSFRRSDCEFCQISRIRFPRARLVAISIDTVVSGNFDLELQPSEFKIHPTEAVMTTRTCLAGLLGGIAMFLWASLAHTVLPLGETGISEIPNETAVVTAMHTALGEQSGLYLFPGTGVAPEASRQAKNEAMREYGQKLATSASGLLIYHPPGAKAITPGQLGTEFLTEVVEAVVVVYLLTQTRLTSFGSRVGFVALAGLMAAITTNISYWNWYGFPVSYTAAYLMVEWIGYIVAGVVAAVVMRKNGRQAIATA
jgi:hypothetical protein